MAYDFCDDTFSDLVKEVYGSRGPARSGHLSHYYDSTPAEKQKIWDDLAEQLQYIVQYQYSFNTQYQLLTPEQVKPRKPLIYQTKKIL